jgi:hypothetical protein
MGNAGHPHHSDPVLTTKDDSLRPVRLHSICRPYGTNLKIMGSVPSVYSAQSQ